MTISLFKVLSKCPQGGSGYFTRDQVDELQSILGLDDHEAASVVARAITNVLVKCEDYVEARKKVPRDSDAKERLREIAKHAKKLERLLSQEPAADSLLSPPKRIRAVGGGFDLDLLLEAGRRPEEFLTNLRILAEQAIQHETDASKFEYARNLLPKLNTKNPEVVIATRILWPELFELWGSVGKRLSSTENGPTHRFLKLVHDVADLPKPKRSTLRDAIKDWNMANAELNKPPVRHGGE